MSEQKDIIEDDEPGPEPLRNASDIFLEHELKSYKEILGRCEENIETDKSKLEELKLEMAVHEKDYKTTKEYHDKIIAELKRREGKE